MHGQGLGWLAKGLHAYRGVPPLTEPKVASLEATTTEDVTVGLLSPEERGPFVGRSLVQAIASLLLVEGMLLDLGKFIMQCGRVLSPELEEESLREEFDDLVTVAKVLDKHSAEKLDVLALQACMSRFEQQKSRRLHKSLMNFPTGISLQKEVGDFIAQVAVDEGCDTDLTLALKTLVEPPVCNQH